MPQRPAEKVVLIVDDEAPVRAVLQAIVGTIPNVRTMTATTAEEAVNLSDRHPVSLVITDMNMPGESGAWLVRQLRSRGRAAPVLLHSGSLADGEEPRMLDMGVARVIRKPAAAAEILQAVSEFLV